MSKEKVSSELDSVFPQSFLDMKVFNCAFNDYTMRDVLLEEARLNSDGFRKVVELLDKGVDTRVLNMCLTSPENIALLSYLVENGKTDELDLVKYVYADTKSVSAVLTGIALGVDVKSILRPYKSDALNDTLIRADQPLREEIIDMLEGCPVFDDEMYNELISEVSSEFNFDNLQSLPYDVNMCSVKDQTPLVLYEHTA